MEALVEFNYVAQEPDELTIRKGDIIKDVKIMSGGWWEGTLRDQRGMFPDNFVKVLETNAVSGVKNEVSVEAKKESVTLRNGSVVNSNSSNSSSCSNINNTNNSSNSNNNHNNNNNNNGNNSNSSSSKWCKVLFSYDPCNEDELGLIPNDMIEYLGQVEEGWWTGRLRGRVGVFPSNFVSPPTAAEDTKELCRVLFAYEAANEDELTLAEGEIVTLISRDAPDKGWWKGELRGKIGLFPDNFVQVLPVKESSHQPDDSNKAVRPLELNRGLKTTTTSSLKQWNTGKKGEKAYARKSLDTRTTTTTTSTTTTDKKNVSPLSPIIASSSVSLNSSSLSDKKVINSSPVSPGIKRLVKSEEISSTLTVDAADHNEGIDEELDGVEREEDTPLLHLTASRVKAPRRRLPSSHHHRQSSIEITVITNGAIDTVDQSKNDDNETASGKNRQPVAPWIEELKFNQMEKKKILSTDKLDKVDAKKDKNYFHESPVHTADTLDQFQFQDNQDSQRLTYQRTNNLHLTGSAVSPTSGTPAYVPYRLYSQLLDRVTTLEERQTVLQRMVVQLSEQVGPLLTNSSAGGNKS